MEVYFLDVGQGTCQVILLGDRRAIVIDCGAKNDQVAIQFLKRTGITFIERLIVSHSHDDHIGGGVSILGEYQDQIGKICFVQDHAFLESEFWSRISEFLKSGLLLKTQLVRLECTEEPQLVWMDAGKNARLRTFSPNSGTNLEAQVAELPNATSAVLFLDLRNERIIFASDSEFSQWREIRRLSGERMDCKVLTVPHHAGQMDATPAELRWVFSEALRAEVAVVSVGTNNTYNHPRLDVMQSMVSQHVKIMCTQITTRCQDDLEALRPGVLKPTKYLGRSSASVDKSGSGRSRNVACAGTICAHVTETEIVVDRLYEHQQSVDRLPRLHSVCPLCRSTD